MPKTIWKFELPPDGLISMPLGAQVLDVQIQDDRPVMWALVDPDARCSVIRLALYGTGQTVPNRPGNYLGTFQQHGGALVWHVFSEYLTRVS